MGDLKEFEELVKPHAHAVKMWCGMFCFEIDQRKIKGQLGIPLIIGLYKLIQIEQSAYATRYCYEYNS